MLYNDACGERLSRLGFGTMRLPLTEGGGDADIDEKASAEMFEAAIKGGVNYFDTAFPYHGGMSEVVTGRLLSDYPRDSYYLATKYPGHQISSSYNPAEVFELQLKKTGVDHFDFYLLHNVYEKSMGTYTDSRWGIIDYFVRQKQVGKIRHLGFSSHAHPETLERFLDSPEGREMEFCQIQLNYLDWSLQEAEKKYRILCERGIPVWVMEPVRGGRLAKLDEDSERLLREARPDESTAAWAFRWLQGLENARVILSGMTTLKQVEDNLRTFSDEKPLTKTEAELITRISDKLAGRLPCTACRYCCEGCPMGLDIPTLLSVYDDVRFSASFNIGMFVDSLPEDKRPSACIGCGKCASICPQGIKIPEVMRDLSNRLASMPSWAEICRKRDEAAAKADVRG